MATYYGTLKDSSGNDLYLNFPNLIRISGSKSCASGSSVKADDNLNVPAGTYLFLFFADWSTGGSDTRNISFIFSSGSSIRTVRSSGTNGGGVAGWAVYGSSTAASYSLSFYQTSGSASTARYDCIAIRLY